MYKSTKIVLKEPTSSYMSSLLHCRSHVTKCGIFGTAPYTKLQRCWQMSESWANENNIKASEATALQRYTNPYIIIIIIIIQRLLSENPW